VAVPQDFFSLFFAWFRNDSAGMKLNVKETIFHGQDGQCGAFD
jgi:hypothetical protein